MLNWLRSFLPRSDGVTAIEYALIAGTMAVVLVATVPSVGTALIPIFETIANSF